MAKFGCVPYTKRKGKTYVYKCKGTKSGWVFPKGTRKKKESAKQCALREMFEETGLLGRIKGRTKTKKGNVFYLVKVTKKKKSPEKRKLILLKRKVA
jgi:8-oxo-dGTP pyrophosphatase MutT (NUDIX family)